MNTSTKKNLLVPAWLVLAFLLAGCSKPAPQAEPVRSVKVITIASSSYGFSHEYAGDVRARLETRVGFRVGGKIIRRQAEIGQQVLPGQVLAQLDPQDLRLAADAGRAQVAAATTNRDLAAAEFRRYKELRDQNFISNAELERREATLKALDAQVSQARAQLAAQGNQTSYATLQADVAGIVTAVEAEPGQVVAAGTPVVRIAANGPRDVVFSVPEDRVGSIKPGRPVALRAWSQGNAALTGTVREVAASSDPVTRTFAVKVAIQPDPAAAPLPLGATVYAQLATDNGLNTGAAVIKLPTSALRQVGNTTTVWVLNPEGMTVQPQTIQIATADGNEVVVASGLKPGMQVVSAGVHVLSPGQKVTIYVPKVAPGQQKPAREAINSIAPAPVSTASTPPVAVK